MSRSINSPDALLNAIGDIVGLPVSKPLLPVSHSGEEAFKPRNSERMDDPCLIVARAAAELNRFIEDITGGRWVSVLSGKNFGIEAAGSVIAEEIENGRDAEFIVMMAEVATVLLDLLQDARQLSGLEESLPVVRLARAVLGSDR